MDDPIEAADMEAMVRVVPANTKNELRLWLRMLSCANLISNDVRQRLRRQFNMTLPQFDLLAQLYREPDGLRLTELSRRMMVTNGNVTGLVDRLVGDGVVLRSTDLQDRRAIVVCLSDKGRAEFAVIAAAHERWIKALLSGLNPAEQEALTRKLGGLKASVRAAASAS